VAFNKNQHISTTRSDKLELKKNVSTSLPFDHQTATRARSMVSEHAPKGLAGQPDIPPYFSWPGKSQVSAAELWGSYLKSLLRF
jgi:hypothetical protein